jgi:hypothetical protein
MRDILRLNAELQSTATEEMETLLAERAVFRSILENRAKELATTLDNELRRIENWAEQQKQMMRETFNAMMTENQLDMERNDALVHRIGGDQAVDTHTNRAIPLRTARPALRPVSKSAVAFSKAAE